MAKVIRKIEQKQIPNAAKKRVAAYARVSVPTERLLHSLDEQISYYSALIQKTPGWEYAGVFADRGISGTQSATRDQFQKMLAECEAGHIDIILTKSLSRFARNTVDTLQTVRRLRSLGVEVRFEKEGINTLDESGELMITLFASFAQEESRSISENCKWGIRKRFQNGTIGVANKHRPSASVLPPAMQSASSHHQGSCQHLGKCIEILSLEISAEDGELDQIEVSAAVPQHICIRLRHHPWIVAECAAAECTQHKDVYTIVSSHSENGSGALFMEPLQVCRQDADSLSAFRVIQIGGRIAQIGRCTGNHIDRDPILLRQALRVVLVRLADHNARRVNAGIGMKNVTRSTVDIVVVLPQEPAVERRIKR